ncbi:hypothetical protein F4859DRAFT_499220 [Xylaria cf. heliscus]|nr:hypothetical protein F4859DRAFT_499220 [Xylaria cf. heliscus]
MIERERMGLCDNKNAEDDSIKGAQSQQLRLTPAERAACLGGSINPEGTNGLVRVYIPDDILDFGPVICEINNVLLFHKSPVHKFISALKRDSLILVAARQLITTNPVSLLRFLRLGILNLPELPVFPEDYSLASLYEDSFDPEIAIASTAYTARIGQKRKIDPDCQPLIQIPSTDEEKEMVTKLYYTKGTRWWMFSSRLLFLAARQLKFDPVLCRDMIDSIASQLVLQRDESTTF